MTRNCPVCDSDRHQLIRQQDFSDGQFQELVSCGDCGMVFARISPKVDYGTGSMYAMGGAGGSGETPMERQRLWETVRIIENVPVAKQATILDVGCARGGMLEALTTAGYLNVMGMDPSAGCVAACHRKGLRAVQGTLEDEFKWKFDLVILSHVLEHVWDVPASLKQVHRLLKPGGLYYIEVPDAEQYVANVTVPFLEINREHVNHFSRKTLGNALRMAGLARGEVLGGTRDIRLVTGCHPAIFAIGREAEKKSTTLDILPDFDLIDKMRSYISMSEKELEAINMRLIGLWPKGAEIAIWGYGELAQQLLRIEAVRRARVVQVVDSDPGKIGRQVNDEGLVVEYPNMLRPGIPVLIASVMAREGIYKAGVSMGLKDRMVAIL